MNFMVNLERSDNFTTNISESLNSSLKKCSKATKRIDFFRQRFQCNQPTSSVVYITHFLKPLARNGFYDSELARVLRHLYGNPHKELTRKAG